MRHISQIIFLLLCAIAVTTSSVAQSLYKSIGPDGKVVYSDHPPVGARIEKTMQFTNLPSTSLPASASSYAEQLRRTQASPVTAASAGVVLYSAKWCGYCKQAKAYLASKNIAYQDFDIDTREGMTAYVQAGGGKSIPLLVASGQHVQGFSPSAYDELFANRK